MLKILLKRFYVLLSKINQIKTLSLGEPNHLLQRDDVTYIECQSEKQLLMEFFKFWTKNYPDIITVGILNSLTYLIYVTESNILATK